MNRKNKMDLEGAGFFDYIKNVFTANDRFTNKATDMLKKYGGFEIVNIEIVRTPIMSIIDKAINLVSMGKFNELKKKYNYDDMNHLYAVFTVSMNGNRIPILVEKNEVINIDTKIPAKTPKSESLMIGTPRNKLTIAGLLDNTLKAIGADNFYIYDGFGNRNCQSFIKSILQSNQLYSDRINSFVFQPMEQFSKDLGKSTTGFSKLITDTGAFFSRLRGEGNPDGYELHAVIVKKPISLEELQKIHSEFIKDKKKTFIRETKLSYRLRNIPKQRFIKDSFRTKKINKEISLIFGLLK